MSDHVDGPRSIGDHLFVLMHVCFPKHTTATPRFRHARIPSKEQVISSDRAVRGRGVSVAE